MFAGPIWDVGPADADIGQDRVTQGRERAAGLVFKALAPKGKHKSVHRFCDQRRQVLAAFGIRLAAKSCGADICYRLRPQEWMGAAQTRSDDQITFCLGQTGHFVSSVAEGSTGVVPRASGDQAQVPATSGYAALIPRKRLWALSRIQRAALQRFHGPIALHQGEWMRTVQAASDVWSRTRIAITSGWRHLARSPPASVCFALVRQPGSPYPRAWQSGDVRTSSGR